MGRRAQGRIPGDTQVFIPPVMGNEIDPDPVVVHFRVISESERRYYSRKMIAEKEAKPGQSWSDDAIRDHVINVEGYFNRAGAPIKTGDDYATHAEPEFYWAVVNKILESGDVTEDEKKTSADSSSSKPPAIQGSNGTAPIAVPAPSVPTVDAIARTVSQQDFGT